MSRFARRQLDLAHHHLDLQDPELAWDAMVDGVRNSNPSSKIHQRILEDMRLLEKEASDPASRFRYNPIDGDDLTYDEDMRREALSVWKRGNQALIDYAAHRGEEDSEHFINIFKDISRRARKYGKFSSAGQKKFWRDLFRRMERHKAIVERQTSTAPIQTQETTTSSFVPPTTLNIPSKFVEGSPDYLPPSNYQLAIRDAYLNTKSHIIVDAKAGSGKTTTIEWLLSTTYDPSIKIMVLAFNTSIKRELTERVNRIGMRRVFVKSINGLGHGVLCRSYPKVGPAGMPKKAGAKTRLLATRPDCGIGPDGLGFPYTIADQTAAGLSLSKGQKARNKLMVKLLAEIIGKIKLTLTPPDRYDELISTYDIKVEELSSADQIILMETIPQLLTKGIEVVEEEGLIDFNDQVFMPIVGPYQQKTGEQIIPEEALDQLKRMSVPTAAVTLVDETQDLDRASQELALATQARMICVGDPFQSIYHFKGADFRSMDRLFDLLDGTEERCVVMPLSISWRCPTSVIVEAQGTLKQVINQETPTIEAEAHAPIGVLETQKYPVAMAALSPDDAGNIGDTPKTMILCGRNAPLFNTALRLIARGIPAAIKGREIANKILSYIDDVSPKFNNSVPVLSRSLAQRFKKLEALEKKSGQSYDTERDTIAVIQILAKAPDVSDVDGIEKKLKRLFSDKEIAVILSTIHKAKGLEALHVMILEPDRLGRARIDSTEEEVRQAIHMHYVAVTRTKFLFGDPENPGILTYVTGDPSDEELEVDPEFDPDATEDLI